MWPNESISTIVSSNSDEEEVSLSGEAMMGVEMTKNASMCGDSGEVDERRKVSCLAGESLRTMEP